jgi:hypothetical protein
VDPLIYEKWEKEIEKKFIGCPSHRKEFLELHYERFRKDDIIDLRLNFAKCINKKEMFHYLTEESLMGLKNSLIDKFGLLDSTYSTIYNNLLQKLI